MITLLSRTVLIYSLVFAVMRLMGKRQLSDMQPFDLVVTLLIADVAAEPISDCAVPLLYGVVPIFTLFVLHRTVSFISLKSRSARRLVCGNPIFVIAKGTVLENALRAANYTLNDLTEQLRMKDVFSFSEVEYAILETNGSLSVLKKSAGSPAAPSIMLVSDGQIDEKGLSDSGISEEKLLAAVREKSSAPVSKQLFVFAEADGTIRGQEKTKGKSMPGVWQVKISK